MKAEHQIPSWLIGLSAGFAVGIGGAFKDAPYEGFKLATFFRSPIVGLAVGWTIGQCLPTTDPIALFLAAIGGERILVESYKLLRAQRPGKFDFGEWGVPKQQQLPAATQAESSTRALSLVPARRKA